MILKYILFMLGLLDLSPIEPPDDGDEEYPGN